jgi:hypothetical protein
MTLAEIDAGIDALRGALARGEMKVRYADREVIFQSASDLVARLNALRAERESMTSGGGTFRLRSYPVVMRRD